VNAPSLKEDSAATQAAYAAGNRLGEVARELFDLNGLGHTFDLKVDGVASVVAQTQDAIKSTSKTLSRRASLFEAAFEAGGARVLVDVLLPMLGSGKVPRWDIVEVK
jgi:hypothetical protein